MKKYIRIGLAGVLLFTACHGKDDLAKKKEEMAKLQASRENLDTQIDSLQSQIDKLDTAAAAAKKAKLVTVQTIAPGVFKHYIELNGKVDANNVSFVAPRGGPGVVTQLFVQQGDHVRKGQVLLKLDDAVIEQAYNTSKQAITTAQTQLSYLQDIYQRTQNLYNQGVGSKVNLLTAQNNVANAQNQLAIAQKQSQQALEQLNTTSVTSDVDGVVNIMTVKVGETFGSVGSGQIEIVNNGDLKAIASVPEN